MIDDCKNNPNLRRLLSRKAHASREVALIRSEIKELKEELCYKQRFIKEINAVLHKTNGNKVSLRLVYSSTKPIVMV